MSDPCHLELYNFEPDQVLASSLSIPKEPQLQALVSSYIWLLTTDEVTLNDFSNEHRSWQN